MRMDIVMGDSRLADRIPHPAPAPAPTYQPPVPFQAGQAHTVGA